MHINVPKKEKQLMLLSFDGTHIDGIPDGSIISMRETSSVVEAHEGAFLEVPGGNYGDNYHVNIFHPDYALGHITITLQ